MDMKIESQSEEQPSIVVQGNVPAFLLKLWKIVENPQYDHLIAWNQTGRTIKIFDQNEFSKQILPRYYKHNNISSFVRQINMYGFRKIIDSVNGGLKQEQAQRWEFFHRYFQKGRSDQLHLIKRKVHLKEDSKVAAPHLSHLLEDVEKLKTHHDAVDDKLNLVRAENELLWREVSDLRDQHKGQQAIINKLIQFFVKLIMGKATTDSSRKRRALDYPQVESKVSKTSQDLQLYNPQAASLTQFIQEPTQYSVDRQESVMEEDKRLFELPPDTTLVSDQNNAVDDDNIIETILSSDIVQPDALIPTLQSADVNPSEQYTLTYPQMETVPNTKPVRTTVTIIPSIKKTRAKPNTKLNTSVINSLSAYPVNTSTSVSSQLANPVNTSNVVALKPIYPVNTSNIIVSQPVYPVNTSKVMALQPVYPVDTSKVIAPKPVYPVNTSNIITSQPVYPVDTPKVIATQPVLQKSTILFPKIFQDNSNNETSSKESLSTPVVSDPYEIPTIGSCDMLPITPGNGQCDMFDSAPQIPTMITPVTSAPLVTAPVPLYQRQVSFRDRNEISNDVEQISRSIDLLQDMLEKQQINLDLKHLNINQILGDLPSEVSLQNLIRLSQQQQDDPEKNTVTLEEGQVLPYTEPFSPSQLIDEDYASNTCNRSELFDNVLHEDDVTLDALLD